MINNRRGCFGILVFFVMVLIGCAGESPLQATPEPALTIVPTETKIVVVNHSVEPTIELTPTELPQPTPTKTPLATAKVTSTIAPSLEPVSDIHSIWTPLIQFVDTLQGFYILALSPDGKLFAAVDSHDEFSKVYLWEVETTNLRWVADFDQSLSHSGLLFSPNGKMLSISTSTIEQDVFVLDVTNGNTLHHFTYRDHPADMKFSPDSKKLVISGLIPGATTIWNLEDENKTEIGRSLSIDFIPDDTNLVLAVATGQKYADVPSPVYLLDLENDERDYLFLDYYYSGKIAVSPDGKYLGAYVTDELGFGNVRLVNMPEGVEIPLEDAYAEESVAILQISFSVGDHLIALQRGELKIWNNKGQLLTVLEDEDIFGFIISPDEEFLLTYGLYQTPMKVWKFPKSP